MPRWPEISAKERFLQKVWPDLRTQCWLWTGGLHGTGYAAFMDPVTRKTILAHRFSYQEFVGHIPDGMQIDHLCRNRSCVNPHHLEAVSQKENILRGEGATAKNARKTHCPQGHPYSGDNLYTPPSGQRVCRICKNSIAREWKAKKNRLPHEAPE